MNSGMCCENARQRAAIFRDLYKKRRHFVWGAFRDAFCLRKRSWQKHSPLSEMRGSASLCLIALIALLIASWGIAVMSPGVRTQRDLSKIRIYPQSLSDLRIASDTRVPAAVVEEQVRTSLGSRQRNFDGFSYYRITRKIVSSGAASGTQWTVALANSDLFTQLHLPVHFALKAGNTPDKLPRIVLSEETWMKEFGGNPDIAGTEIHLGLLDARVVGVAVASSQDLPGKVNAWLLQPKDEISGDGAGFVIGHLTPYGYFQMGPRWAIPLFGVVLAFLTLPGITSIALGDYSRDSQKPLTAEEARVLAFLIQDLFGVVVCPFCVSRARLFHCAAIIELFGLYPVRFFPCSLPIGTALGFSRSAAALPGLSQVHGELAEVGQSARTLFAWRGTELFCERGHMLLHIPETQLAGSGNSVGSA